MIQGQLIGLVKHMESIMTKMDFILIKIVKVKVKMLTFDFGQNVDQKSCFFTSAFFGQNVD